MNSVSTPLPWATKPKQSLVQHTTRFGLSTGKNTDTNADSIGVMNLPWPPDGYGASNQEPVVLNGSSIFERAKLDLKSYADLCITLRINEVFKAMTRKEAKQERQRILNKVIVQQNGRDVTGRDLLKQIDELAKQNHKDKTVIKLQALPRRFTWGLVFPLKGVLEEQFLSRFSEKDQPKVLKAGLEMMALKLLNWKAFWSTGKKLGVIDHGDMVPHRLIWKMTRRGRRAISES